MEDGDVRKCGFQMDGLSLIDVSSEDDCLLFSSSLDPSFSFIESEIDDEVLAMFDKVPDHNEEIPVSSLHEKEQLLQPHASPEPEKIKRVWMYKFRESLAWDRAFFTSAGVLEPEELFNIIESNQKGKTQALSIIEDVCKSTESTPLLRGDYTSGDFHEPLLSEDNGTSLERCRSCNTTGQNGGEEPGEAEAVTTSSATDTDLVYRNKSKANTMKTSDGAQGLGRIMKQLVSTRGSLFVTKPTKEVGRVGTMSTPTKKRASNQGKLEKDQKSFKGNSAPVTKGSGLSGGTRKTPPKLEWSSKSSPHSLAADKKNLTSSCSSQESRGSASSGISYKSYLNRRKKTTDTSSKVADPSSLVSGSRSQPSNPHISTRLMSKTKLSSLALPAGSCNGSSESSVSFRSDKRSTSHKVSQHTTACETPAKNITVNTLNSRKISDGKCSDRPVTDKVMKRISIANGRAVHPASIIPAGLRIPSPVDGVRTAGRTPPGNTVGVRNRDAFLNSSSSGKLQSGRSPLHGSSNSKPEANSVLRTPTIDPVSSQKKSKTYPRFSRMKPGKVVDGEETKDSMKKSPLALVKVPKIKYESPERGSFKDRDSVFGDMNITLSTAAGHEENVKDNLAEHHGDKSKEQVEAPKPDMRVEVARIQQTVETVKNSTLDEDGTLGVPS